MRARQKMQTFDWVIWAALAATGVFLGLAIDGMFELARIGSWQIVLVLLILAGCWIVFYLLSLRVFEFISTGRFSAPRQLQKPRKPLALVFGLPIGIVIGVIAAQSGLSDFLL